MSAQKTYTRFNVAQRIEHLLLVLSFTLLGITGLIQKFIGVDISLWLIQVMGGITSVRVIHRVAAVVFLVETIYHLIFLGYKVFVQKAEMTMLPGIKDVKDGIQSVGYNLGISKSRPKMGRYTFDEKLEYWAMIWGGVIMALTGFMLWNPIITSRILPGVFIPAAKTAHGAEAVLAVLAILIWHFYHVHFKMFNKSMINGKMTQHQMEEEHPLELETIDLVEEQLIAPKELRKRKMIFFPIASVLSVVMLVGVYYFVTAETTSITTLPPAERVPIISTIAPTALPTKEPTAIPTEAPTATPSPTLAVSINTIPTEAAASALPSVTWVDQISPMFQAKCAMCHGSSGGLSVADYASVLKGGNSGAGIIPGDLPGSQIYSSQNAGGHPGQFTPEELTLLKQWIESGAVEK